MDTEAFTHLIQDYFFIGANLQNMRNKTLNIFVSTIL